MEVLMGMRRRTDRHPGAPARGRGVPGPDGVDQEEHPDDGQDGQVLVGPRDPGLCAGVLEHRDGQGRVSGFKVGWRWRGGGMVSVQKGNVDGMA